MSLPDPASRLPVVVLVFAHRPELDPAELVSLRQCVAVLGHHPLRIVCPAGMDVSAFRTIAPSLQFDFIPPHWLSSYRGYNRLKISPFLYRRYARFDYILTYELDAFVFRDELLAWCHQGWDFIGAPWFEGGAAPLPDAAPAGVGNSGFSLRRTSTMLRVLRSFGYVTPAKTVWAEFWQHRRVSPGALWLLLSRLIYRNNFFAPLNDFAGNEDYFWGLLAARRFPWFRVAPYEVAREFSFETNAPRLFEETGGRLPFGCHKWQQLTPEFWRPFVTASGALAASSSG